jgi:WD40 repeat protein
MSQSISIPDSGISYEAFLTYTATMNIPTEFVDVKATFERYQDVNSSLISTEKVAELKLKTDVFLTHDWGIDELGRTNHDRVAAVNKELKSMGFVTWFDSEKMTGEVVYQMVNGIDNAAVVIVFMTQRYMTKVNGSNANDNCRKEFNYAIQKKSSTKMIPVVMEPRMTDIRGSWTGLVQMELGNILYVDFSNDNDFQSAIQQLKAEILSRTNPLWVLRTSPLTPMSKATPPPPPPGSIKTSETDLLMIEQLSFWLNSLHISFATSRRYAELLMQKDTGSITKLRRKLERNSSYLEEIGDFDEDDIIDIKEGLKLQTVVSSSGNDNRQTDIPDNTTRSKTQSVMAVPPTISKEGEEDLSLLVEKSGKTQLLLSLSSTDNSNVVTSGNAELEVENNKNNESNAIALEGNEIALVVPPLQSQGFPDSNEEQQRPLITPVPESSPKEVIESHQQSLPVGQIRASASRVSFESHFSTVDSLSWDPASNKIASGSYDQTIKIWDGKSLELIKTLQGHSGWVRSVSWNNDGSQIVSGSKDKTIKIWDSWSGKALHTLEGHSDGVASVAWNHDSTKIVSGSVDTTIKVWHWTKSTFSMFSGGMSWKLLKTLKGHSSSVFSVSWNHDGTKIVSGSGDKTIKIWGSSTGIMLTTLIGHSEIVFSVAWSHDGSKIVSGSDDKTVRIWNAITGNLVKTLEGHSSWVTCVAWSPDDRKITSCSYIEKNIIIWDSLTGEKINSFQPVKEVRRIAWSGDGSELVCNEGKKIKVFSFRS